jgi:hypothetical protein
VLPGIAARVAPRYCLADAGDAGRLQAEPAGDLLAGQVLVLHEECRRRLIWHNHDDARANPRTTLLALFDKRIQGSARPGASR